jgi:adenosylcobyric acid synthase
MPRGKAIMVQGTGSHVGKSVLTTAFCRIFRQEGYRVAPFKAQNMSNNAAVCLCGGEIGRAQAEQAAACDVEPTTAMNPILLKPCTDVGCQVIVMGRATGTMTAKQYQAHKLSLVPTVRRAIDSLLDSYDLVVIEGAGSPAEINLKDHDIVNMRTAALADAPVILVGDIDRGGVFAQLVGTFDLLDPAERARVRAFIINKFRGDLDILTPGLRFLEERLGRPVLGVIPWLRSLRVAEEDSLPLPSESNPRLGRSNAPRPNNGLRIDVIRHPRIANFTDFESLGDAVNYVSEPPAELPDAIILPGTKSTVADLAELRRRGFEPWLLRARQAGVEIVGICGGFQMLGSAILDPNHVESSESQVPGLNFLGGATVFQPHKETARVGAVHVASGAEIEAYEIHMGCTQGNPGPAPLFRITRRHGMPAEGYDGMASADGRVWGTYLHGLFDGEAFRGWWLGQLRRRGDGADAQSHECAAPVPPETNRFDALARAVRNSIDVAALHRIVWD